jgi:hypothetical protein
MNRDKDEKMQEVAQFFARKTVTRLFKSFLEINNEIKNEHDIMLGKVSKKTSQDFVENIDYFTSEKSEYFRKKILDSGNECIREISSFLEAFDIEVNEKKLDKLMNSKKIVTRVFSGMTTVREYKDKKD